MWVLFNELYFCISFLYSPQLFYPLCAIDVSYFIYHWSTFVGNLSFESLGLTEVLDFVDLYGQWRWQKPGRQSMLVENMADGALIGLLLSLLPKVIIYLSTPTVGIWRGQWWVMAASHCHSLWRWWSDNIHKVMTTLIFVMHVLAWPALKWWLPSEYCCGVSSAISWICWTVIIATVLLIVLVTCIVGGRVWHDTAIPFTEVLKAFEEWLERQELWEPYSVTKLKDAAFVTWWELLWNILQLLDILFFYLLCNFFLVQMLILAYIKYSTIQHMCDKTCFWFSGLCFGPLLPALWRTCISYFRLATLLLSTGDGSKFKLHS